MADNPRIYLPQSTGDVPGLDTALAGKAGILGAERIVVVRIGDPEPTLVTGDIVLREGEAPAPDTTAPVMTGTLSAVAGDTQVTLSGVSATDAVGVTRFVIEHGATTSYGTTQEVTGATFGTPVVTGLTNGQARYFRVSAYDAASNQSNTATASATPSAAADTTAPSQVAGLSATVSGANINLAWSAATDNVGVTGYKVERATNAGFTTGVTTIAAANVGLTYSDTAASVTVPYWYRVSARDLAGNFGAVSATATATVPDTTAPSLTGTLTATPGDGQVALDWPDATDAVGVTRYVVEHSANADYSAATTVNVDGTPPTSAVTITGLTNADLRYFRVKAQDSATNASGYLTASATPVASSVVVDVDFTANGYTLDTAVFGVVTANSGTGVISNGAGLVLDASGGTTRTSFVYYKTKLAAATTGTYEWWFTVQDVPVDATGDAFDAHFMYSQTTSPTSANSTDYGSRRRIYPAGDGFTAVSGNLRDYYKNNAGTHTSPWSATGNTAVKFDTLLGLRFENDAASSRWRVTFLNAAGAVINTGAWVAWSATQSVSGDLWTLIGAPNTDTNNNPRKMTVKRFRHLSTVGS